MAQLLERKTESKQAFQRVNRQIARKTVVAKRSYLGCLSQLRSRRRQHRQQPRVIKLSSKATNRLRREQARKSNRPHFVAVAVLAAALVLLGLSLSHLASEVAIVTGAGASDGWAMAIGIDLGFIACHAGR